MAQDSSSPEAFGYVGTGVHNIAEQPDASSQHNFSTCMIESHYPWAQCLLVFDGVGVGGGILLGWCVGSGLNLPCLLLALLFAPLQLAVWDELKQAIRAGSMNEMMKCADVLETISPVTGSLCVPAGGCSEVIVLARAGKRRQSLERRGDLIEADSGLKKNVLYIYLQSPPSCQALVDYVSHPKDSLFRRPRPLTRNLPKLSQTPTTCPPSVLPAKARWVI